MKYLAKITNLTKKDCTDYGILPKHCKSDKTDTYFEAPTPDIADEIERLNKTRTEEKTIYEHFKPLLTAIDSLNELATTVSPNGIFTTTIEGNILYVHGTLEALSALAGLLWARCDNYSFYFAKHDGKNAIEVM